MLWEFTVEILFVMVALLLGVVAALPAWPYSVNWGYYPTSACGLAVVLMAVLAVVGIL
jgi:hypothetical protein